MEKSNKIKDNYKSVSTDLTKIVDKTAVYKAFGVTKEQVETKENEQLLNIYIKLHTPKIKKPPLGLMPKKLWEQLRIQEIVEAIERYANENMPIPAEWIKEYLELQRKYQLL